MPQSIDTLTTRFEADLQKWEAGMKKMVASGESAANSVVKKHQAAHDKINKLWGETSGIEAFNKVLGNTRLTVFEEGATRIPIFGSALEALGPAGLAAAAGLAAVAGAMEMAKGAAEYAEEIANTAAKLGITTKALQEYNYAAIASGVSTDAMKEALEEGNKVLGDFQSNMASGKAKKVFQALGITQEEAQKAKTITDLLPEIADKIQKLSAAEQQAVAKRLGMDSILPLLQKGGEAIRDMQTEAEKSGAVLDTELIAKGKEAAETMKEAGQAVDINLKRAFIGLAPVISDIVKLIGEMTKGIADTIEAFGSISNYSRVHVQDAMKDVQRGMNTDTALGANKWNPVATANYKWLQGQMQQLKDRQSELDKIDAAADAKTHAGTSGELVPDKAKPKGDDQTAQYDSSSKGAEDEARKSLMEAYANLTKNIEAHAAFELQATDADTAKKLEELSKQEEEIRKSKIDAHKQEQIALLEKAKTETQNAGEAKKELIERQKQVALDEQYTQIQDEIDRTYSEIAQIRASMAPTAAARNQINTANLMMTQKRERDDFETKAQDRLLMSPGDTDLQSTINTQRNALMDKQQAQRDQLQYNQANPVEQWARSVSDLQTAFDNIKVKGLEGITDAITGAIMHTKSLGQAFHEVAQSIIADLVKIGVEKMITVPLATALFGNNGTTMSNQSTATGGLFGGILHGLGIPGFAQGTANAPGGLAMVGEMGPELVNLPKGSQVIPNNRLNTALGKATTSVYQPVFNLTTQVSANDAVLTPTIQGWIYQSHVSAIQTARALAAQDYGKSARASLNR